MSQKATAVELRELDVNSSCRAILFFFFFSSRRRHTRFDCDWSSDVCSSDLGGRIGGLLPLATRSGSESNVFRLEHLFLDRLRGTKSIFPRRRARLVRPRRSEGRRVGEEGRSRWSPDHLKKKSIRYSGDDYMK